MKSKIIYLLFLFPFLFVTYSIQYNNDNNNNNLKLNSPTWPFIYSNYTWSLKAWGGANDNTTGAMVVDLDIDEQVDMIKPLRDAGHIIICYFSIGTMEPWRPDVEKNKKEWESACVHKMKHWDECWLDITKIELLQKLQSPRFLKAVKEGCHGIEPDNIDCYANKDCYHYMGISSREAKPYQLAYNNWTASYAHSLGLAVAMKNAVDLIPETNNWYDFAINEQCGLYEECSGLETFINTNRLVAQVEYNIKDKWCKEDNKNHFMGKMCDGSQDNGLCHKGSTWNDCYSPWSGPLPPIHWH